MKENHKAEKALEGMLRRGLAGAEGAGGKDCPEAEILAAYFDRAMKPEETAKWELHFSECARCQEQLSAMARAETAFHRDAITAAPSGIWWRWRYWLAPAATAAAAVALWVAVRPAPPRTETAQVRTEQQVVAPSTKREEAPRPPQAAAPVETAAGKIRPEKDVAETQEKDAGEKRKADSASIPARRGEEGTLAGRGAPATKVAAAAPPSTPAATDKLQSEFRKNVPAPILSGQAERSDELAKLKMEPAAPPRPQAVADANADKKSRVLAQVQPHDAQEAKAAEQEAAAPVAGVAAQAPMPSGQAAPSAGVAAQTAAGAPASRFGMMRAGVLPSREPGKWIASPSGNTVWSVSPGMVAGSRDKGATWVVIWREGSVILHAGAASSETVCWIVGERGTVLRTTDGKRFEKTSAPTDAALAAVEAQDALHAKVKTTTGETYVTRDGGKSWRKE